MMPDYWVLALVLYVGLLLVFGALVPRDAW